MQGSSAWRRAVWRLSDDSQTLLLPGGSGRAAAKGEGRRSDCASESSLVLPPGFHVSFVSDAHWSGPLLHRLGFRLQPGECCRSCGEAFVELSLTTLVDGFILKQNNRNQGGFLGLIYEYLPSIVITAGNFVVPALGDQIARVERYSPSTTIILALLRFALLLGWWQSQIKW